MHAPVIGFLPFRGNQLNTWAKTKNPKAKENGNALKYGKEFFSFSGYA